MQSLMAGLKAQLEAPRDRPLGYARDEETLVLPGC